MVGCYKTDKCHYCTHGDIVQWWSLLSFIGFKLAGLWIVSPFVGLYNTLRYSESRSPQNLQCQAWKPSFELMCKGVETPTNNLGYSCGPWFPQPPPGFQGKTLLLKTSSSSETELGGNELEFISSYFKITLPTVLFFP